MHEDVQDYLTLASRIAPSAVFSRWHKSRVTRWDYEVTRRTLFEELNPHQEEVILEIGCGPATWTEEVAECCKRLVAVDISKEMIDEAQKHTQGLPVEYVHSDFLRSQLTEKFDHVFSVRAIEYIHQLDQLAKKIAQLVVPGGRVVFITKSRFSLWRGRVHLTDRLWNADPGASNHSAERRQDFQRQQLLSPGQLARAFKPYGFTVRNVRPVVIRFPFFQNGFHEIPLIPEEVSSYFLRCFSFLYEVGSRTPRRLAALPILLSESYCVTLHATGMGLEDPKL